MSVWGKLIGGAIGLTLGGPLGALIGVGVGHLTDKHRKEAKKFERLGYSGSPGQNERQENQQATFILSFVALAAKLSKVDGRVTQIEFDTLKRIFPMPGFASTLLSRMFMNASNDATGFEEYANQIASIFRNSPKALEDLLGALVLIAQSDGVLHPAEKVFLKRVSEIFGFVPDEYSRIFGIYSRLAETDGADPYQVLGVAPDASDSAIKSAHRKILRENHPDVAMGRGLPEEFIAVSNRKMAEANSAYDRIKKERGIS